MEESEVKRLIFLTWNDKWSRTSVLSVFALFIFLSLFLSVVSGIIVLGSYVAGFLVFKAVFCCQSVSRNPLSLFVEKNLGLSPAALPCSVCGDGKCKRHRPTTAPQQPWKNLYVPEEIDEAIEDFLNKTLSEYVYSWYGNLSSDEAFVLELRQCVRQAASALLVKCLSVDLAALVVDRLVPAGLRHLDDHMTLTRHAARDGRSIEAAAAQHLGARLHPALRSREHELKYLRELASLLLPKLLQDSQNDSSFVVLVRELLAGWVLLPLADTLADPAIIDSLLILLLSSHQLTEYPDTPGNTVEFLARFAANPPAANESALRVDMACVLKDQDLLYFFMQFLKNEGSVNVLQFCLDVEEFNRKMLNPDLTPDDLNDLHKEAWDLYSVYFSEESPDSLHFAPSLVDDMKAVVCGPASGVVQLRTTPPLFQAYEAAYAQLEGHWCPLFHQSDAFYTHLCGRRLPEAGGRSGPRAGKRWDGGVGAKISSRLHKIRGALRAAHPIEGSAFDADTALDMQETEFAEDLATESPRRDLSAWRVSVIGVDANAPMFLMEVQRVDVGTGWRVQRRYNDFYLLESKLTEFHGEFTDAQLPPKRLLLGPRGIEMMREKRQQFEQYLQLLLSKSSLRGSDLLHAFLRPDAEFVPAQDGLGRMLRRSVPLKLRKERGQHLEPFMQTFLQATETARHKTSKYEWQDVTARKPPKVRCLTSTLFGDNLALSDKEVTSQPTRCLQLHGVFDCILFLVVRVLGASQALVCALLALRTVCQDTVNACGRYWLQRRLRRLMAAPRMAHLVRLLQTAVFVPRVPLTERDRADRADTALRRLEAALPGFAQRAVGARWKEGVGAVFAAYHTPKLNKQLAYTLLDIVVAELYPDLDSGIMSPQLVDK